MTENCIIRRKYFLKGCRWQSEVFERRQKRRCTSGGFLETENLFSKQATKVFDIKWRVTWAAYFKVHALNVSGIKSTFDLRNIQESSGNFESEDSFLDCYFNKFLSRESTAPKILYKISLSWSVFTLLIKVFVLSANESVIFLIVIFIYRLITSHLRSFEIKND